MLQDASCTWEPPLREKKAQKSPKMDLGSVELVVPAVVEDYSMGPMVSTLGSAQHSVTGSGQAEEMCNSDLGSLNWHTRL